MTTPQNAAKTAFNSPQNVRLQKMGRMSMYICLISIIFSFLLWGTNLWWVGPIEAVTSLILVISIYPKLAPGPWEFTQKPMASE